MQDVAPSRRHRRTGARVALAAGLAVGVGAAAIGLGSGASADIAPEQAVEQAAERLSELPGSVSISGPGEGTVTLTMTDDGAAVRLDSAEGALDAALRDERLFLRIEAEQLQSGAGMALGLLGNIPSIATLLDGGWVSVDVSEDSEVLDALREAGAGAADRSDPEGLRAAAEELHSSLESIAEQLREPVSQALQSSSDVAEVADGPAGPAGSVHYRVMLDREAAAADLEPALRSAVEQSLAAVDAFVAQAGEQLPDGRLWSDRRAELLAAFDEALAKTAQAPASMDVWIADGRFTQIVVEDATLTFTTDGDLGIPSDAVSMDRDLVTLLPLLQGLQNLQLPKPAA